MREILFRAWDKVKKTMHKGAERPYMYLTNSGRHVGIGCDLHHSLYHDTSRNFDDEVILMQYTGLKDKNGKKIFEGDIVDLAEHDMDEWRSCVEYNEYWTGFGVSDGGAWYRLGDFNKLEVIGNVYEHSSLLEQK